MKLRDLSRDELYVLEEKLFQNVDYLTKKRTPKQLKKMVERFNPDAVLHLEWEPDWERFDLDDSPKIESESWVEEETEDEYFNIKIVPHIYLVPAEHSYHWILHELAHTLQGYNPDTYESEEHSPEWAFLYASLLKRVGHRFSALKLLENLI